jgi:hypothetical protein
MADAELEEVSLRLVAPHGGSPGTCFKRLNREVYSIQRSLTSCRSGELVSHSYSSSKEVVAAKAQARKIRDGR